MPSLYVGTGLVRTNDSVVFSEPWNFGVSAGARLDLSAGAAFSIASSRLAFEQGLIGLADLERDLPDSSVFTLVTQNVDGLHLKAGSRRVIEIHGRLSRTRCSDPGCGFTPRENDYSYGGAVPICPTCGKNLRLDVVIFGESLGDAMSDAIEALENCDLFIAIGTSGTVYPANGLVSNAARFGARTVLINLEPMDPPNPIFREEHLGPAEDVVPTLLKV